MTTEETTGRWAFELESPFSAPNAGLLEREFEESQFEESQFEDPDYEESEHESLELEGPELEGWAELEEPELEGWAELEESQFEESQFEESEHESLELEEPQLEGWAELEEPEWESGPREAEWEAGDQFEALGDGELFGLELDEAPIDELEDLTAPEAEWESLLELERTLDEAPARRAAPVGAAYWQKVLRFGLAGNTVEPLIDGRSGFAAMQRAIESADSSTHFVYLLGWWCDPWVNLSGPGTCLLDLFKRAGDRGVQIRVLLWDAPFAIYANHSRLHDEAVAALNRIPGCHAQQDDGGLTKSHHQKLLVVKGRNGLVGLGGGVDFNADRIHSLPPPTSAYRADRPRHLGWIGASGGSGSGAAGAGEPLHDVHVRVTGPSALPLLRMFRRRWLARSGDRSIDRSAPLRGRYREPVPRPTGRQFVRVGETFNGVLRPVGGRAFRSRTVDVQDIWLRSILGARRFIYMEEQYLISLCAAEAIRTVLPRLQHVTILIPPSEITDLPGKWRRRREFIERITRGTPHAGKLHVYTRATRPVESCRRSSGAHLYIHSKMAVIDDELMLIGSANCNNRGWETDSELVVASFEDAPRGRTSTAQRLRMALWAHHLDQPAASLTDPVRSRALWDSAPTRHVCRYDPRAGTDGGLIQKPGFIVDPSDRRPTDPCCTLLRLCP